jgi:hypothetical protein
MLSTLSPRASPLAGYINGANLRIDGGSTAVV